MPREGREGGREAEGGMGRRGEGKGEGGETGGPGLFLLYLVLVVETS
jgi:hypothetical protein